jgi:hypothetical protein
MNGNDLHFDKQMCVLPEDAHANLLTNVLRPHSFVNCQLDSVLVELDLMDEDLLRDPAENSALFPLAGRISRAIYVVLEYKRFHRRKRL